MPGLYVMDSIVRQSRHQFGAEKDVFATRFSKNIVPTFQNLFKCPPDEKVGIEEQRPCSLCPNNGACSQTENTLASGLMADTGQ